MRGLMTQLQVVHALILREVRTRFGRHRLGYLWALVEPMLFVALFATMITLLDRGTPYGLPVVPFLVTGFVPYLTFSNLTSKAMLAISSNRGLLFFPDVRPLDLVLARVLLEISTYMIVFTILMGAWCLWQGEIRIDSVPQTLAGLLLASGLGAGLGLVLCGLSAFSNTVERLVGPAMRPLFWVSALFFSTNELPTEATDVLVHNPVLHVVELTRGGWFSGYDVPQVNVWYPAIWIVVLFYFGLTLERVARRRLELT